MCVGDGGCLPDLAQVPLFIKNGRCWSHTHTHVHLHSFLDSSIIIDRTVLASKLHAYCILDVFSTVYLMNFDVCLLFDFEQQLSGTRERRKHNNSISISLRGLLNL